MSASERTVLIFGEGVDLVRVTGDIEKWIGVRDGKPRFLLLLPSGDVFRVERITIPERGPTPTWLIEHHVISGGLTVRIAPYPHISRNDQAAVAGVIEDVMHFTAWPPPVDDRYELRQVLINALEVRFEEEGVSAEQLLAIFQALRSEA